HFAGAADVVNCHTAGCAVNEAFFARKIQSVKRTGSPIGNGGKPYFLAVGTPGQALHAGIKRRAGFSVAVLVDDDDAAVVAALDVISERKKLTVGRKANMADPGRRRVDHGADRIFEKIAVASARANHYQRIAVCRPIS